LNVAFALKNNFDIYVLTTDTDHGETNPYNGIPSNTWTSDIDRDIKIYYTKKSTLSHAQLRKQIIAVNPDYIYLNHVWSPYFVLYPLWLKYKGNIRGKIILCPRGGLYDSALSVKPYKKKPLLRLMKALGIQNRIVFHATNDREKDAIQLYFPGGKIVVADNLPTANQPTFISCLKEVGAVKCIFIARIVAIKNLLFVLKVLEKVKLDVMLTIVGPAEDKVYWELCLEKVKNLPKNITVVYEGPKHNDELQPILQQHHLFVLPTTGENFGHSIFEALLAGRPVLISDQTPWLNLKFKNIGWDLPLEEPDKFGSVIEQVAGFDQRAFDEMAYSAWSYAKEYIGSPVVKEKYLELFS